MCWVLTGQRGGVLSELLALSSGALRPVDRQHATENRQIHGWSGVSDILQNIFMPKWGGYFVK